MRHSLNESAVTDSLLTLLPALSEMSSAGARDVILGLIRRASQPVKKPTYCLGRETIEKVAAAGELQTEQVNFVASSELFRRNPFTESRQPTSLLDINALLFAQCARAHGQPWEDKLNNAYDTLSEVVREMSQEGAA